MNDEKCFRAVLAGKDGEVSLARTDIGDFVGEKKPVSVYLESEVFPDRLSVETFARTLRDKCTNDGALLSLNMPILLYTRLPFDLVSRRLKEVALDNPDLMLSERRIALMQVKSMDPQVLDGQLKRLLPEGGTVCDSTLEEIVREFYTRSMTIASRKRCPVSISP